MDVEVCAIDFLLQARVEEEEFDGLDGSTGEIIMVLIRPIGGLSRGSISISYNEVIKRIKQSYERWSEEDEGDDDGDGFGGGGASGVRRMKGGGAGAVRHVTATGDGGEKINKIMASAERVVIQFNIVTSLDEFRYGPQQKQEASVFGKLAQALTILCYIIAYSWHLLNASRFILKMEIDFIVREKTKICKLEKAHEISSLFAPSIQLVISNVFSNSLWVHCLFSTADLGGDFSSSLKVTSSAAKVRCTLTMSSKGSQYNIVDCLIKNLARKIQWDKTIAKEKKYHQARENLKSYERSVLDIGAGLRLDSTPIIIELEPYMCYFKVSDESVVGLEPLMEIRDGSNWDEFPYTCISEYEDSDDEVTTPMTTDDDDFDPESESFDISTKVEQDLLKIFEGRVFRFMIKNRGGAVEIFLQNFEGILYTHSLRSPYESAENVLHVRLWTNVTNLRQGLAPTSISFYTATNPNLHINWGKFPAVPRASDHLANGSNSFLAYPID
ncbi:hypothetical protein Scep_001778 [Stephania cephalantha]|uniref:Uncharacterized protein n=1 Tax=Stephania cephalantha TaxID=152367 RepID=A0AAP0L8N1_9MAGN